MAIEPILMILYLCGVSCLVFFLIFINQFIIGIQNRGGWKWFGMKYIYIYIVGSISISTLVWIVFVMGSFYYWVFW
jgi:hypothetical protein